MAPGAGLRGAELALAGAELAGESVAAMLGRAPRSSQAASGKPRHNTAHEVQRFALATPAPALPRCALRVNDRMTSRIRLVACDRARLVTRATVPR